MKTISGEELPEGDRIYLEICGANSSAKVFVNEKMLAEHDGGYSTWRIDMTEELKDENQIVIVVDNEANEYVYPQTADFTFYGGLYRNVNLIGVSNSHFDLDYYGTTGIKVTPDIKGADADVLTEVFVTNKKDGQFIRYRIYDQENNLIAEEKSCNESAEMKISDVHLWHGRKNPYLYTAVAELLEDDRVMDSVTTRFGCRTFEIHPEKAPSPRTESDTGSSVSTRELHPLKAL